MKTGVFCFDLSNFEINYGLQKTFSIWKSNDWFLSDWIIYKLSLGLSSSWHTGLLVINQSESSVWLVFRSIVGSSLASLVFIRHLKYFSRKLPNIFVNYHSEHKGFGITDHCSKSCTTVDSFANLTQKKYFKRFILRSEDLNLNPAEPKGLSTKPLSSRMSASILAASRDANVVIGTSWLGVVSVHDTLHVQRWRRGHLAGVTLKYINIQNWQIQMGQ